MSKFKLTPEQSLATGRKSSLLVSAAAGSGKTRVLTSRLISYVTDESEPWDIDGFLVITYTRAAAAELRARIAKELSALSAENPANRRLRRQVMKSYKAQIGTIHSFCTALLRENGHLIGLAPDFSVADEDICRQLSQKALDKTLEDAYERIAEDGGFAALADSVGAGRDDSRLMGAVLDLHSKLQSHPYPEKWANEQIAAMTAGGVTDAGDTPWGRYLMEQAGLTVRFWTEKLSTLWYGLCDSPEENAPLIKAYGESLNLSLEGLENLQRGLARSWDETVRALPVPFIALKPLKNYEFDDRKQEFTAIRNECKKACERLAATFDSPSE
jgi:ATP-dependent helicase/nuclease subunit A